MKHGSSMRLTIAFGLFLYSITFFKCSNMNNPTGINSVVPFPKTSGIIPLTSGNIWVYTYTSFDSTGKQSGEQYRLSLSIGNVYRRTGDSLQLCVWNATDTPEPYCYEYKYDAQDTGMLLMNQTTGNTIRGTYVLGNYTKTQRVLFKDPVLWLKYPADSGDKWTVTLENEIDTQTIQVMSTSVTYYYVNNTGSVSPVTFLTGCYLYKVEKGLWTTWFYYHYSIGMVAFLEYKNGILRRSGLLHTLHQAT
jgi:hypothetical protein